MTSTASTRRRGSTPLSLKALLIAGFLLGAAATMVVVVFSDQVRWLRIGVLLALWAALCAAFAVARSRREAQSVSAREAEITRTYQLELHREVSARREYESALTDRVRTEVETKQADELTAVRAQLDRLTAALSNLLDGDVLVERLTLSAESTRLRGLTEAGRSLLTGLNHPELGRLQSDDDDAIDAELVDDELPDTGESEDADSHELAGSATAEAEPHDADDVSGAADSREPDDAIEPAAGSGPAAADSAIQASGVVGVGAAASTGRGTQVGTAVLDKAGEPPHQRPVLPSQLTFAPRPDAPSAAWTRRHRKDVVQAAAVVAADHSASERAAAAEAAAAREGAATKKAAVDKAAADKAAAAEAAEDRAAAEKATAEQTAADKGGAAGDTSESTAESPVADQQAPAGGRGGHELNPNAHEDAGSARVSVAQLLAALGSNVEPSHGRRRAAD